jgi:hypothetical protein
VSRREGGRVIDLDAERAARAHDEPVQGPYMSAWIDGAEVVVEFPGGERCRLTPRHLRMWRDNFAALLSSIEGGK